MLIWDYYNVLTNLGIEVEIINTPNQTEIVNTINSSNFDVVHIHYDMFVDIIPLIKSSTKVIISSHYPFISNSEMRHYDGYNSTMGKLVKNTNYNIFASSQNDIDVFVKHGADTANTFVSRLGVKSKDYTVYDSFQINKTLCFSQLVERKRQFLIQDIEDIDFMGAIKDTSFTRYSQYVGELERSVLNKTISKYANFILLSRQENATPLVVKEALVCGLGVVVSESVAQELDTSLDFITVIPEDRVASTSFVKEKINENKEASIKNRTKIVEYGKTTFDLEQILINEYVPKIKELIWFTHKV